MPGLAGLQRRLKQWKPTVVSTFVVYVQPQESPVTVPEDDEFEIVEIRSPDDPLLPRLCSSKRQLQLARESLGRKDWDVIAALKDGEPVGRIWEGWASERRFFSGVPRFTMAPDEIFMFDLFVEREYRRSSVAFTMADFFFKKYDPATTTVKYVYGFIAYDNVPSIMWHHSVGFNTVQTVNMLHIGPYIKWKIPFSDVPRFGPLSRHNRRVDPDRDLFGPKLLP